MTAAPRILVAGLGNIFLGDDAFGVEVARALMRSPPGGARVVDFGIRGMALTYALLDGYALVILVDAVSRGGPPGTIYLIEPTAATDAAGRSPAAIDGHDMDPAKVLQAVSAMGGRVERLLLVGCEPTPIDESMPAIEGLTAPVREAVGQASDLIRQLVADEAAGIASLVPRSQEPAARGV